MSFTKGYMDKDLTILALTCNMKNVIIKAKSRF